MPRVVFSKEFGKCLKDLLKSGGHGRSVVTKARAAQSEAAMEGEIRALNRTHHGESRLPNIEKYDLGDGYRLVVQLVDGIDKVRAFLYCGKHDDVDGWLNSHKDYVWVKKPTDGTLDFVQVSKANPPQSHVPDLDLVSPPSLLELPLLRDLTVEQWNTISVPLKAEEYARRVTAEAYEQDGGGVLDHLIQLADSSEKANLLLDLLDLAHRREWNALHRRVELASGVALEVTGEEAAEAMLSPANTEIFVTWDDAHEIDINQDWAEWMLFLHPEQKELVKKDMSGPARLRGVSGSGKTCVIIHRARYLAKLYGEKVLVVTLTESMRRLLDSLLGMLCGAERVLIQTSTVSGLARDIIRDLHPRSETWYTQARPDRLSDIARKAVDLVWLHQDFQKSPLKKLDKVALELFLKEEIGYVRSRLSAADYGQYPTKQFKRQGRQQSLAEDGRRVCLDAIRFWDAELHKSRLLDHEGIVQAALDLIINQDFGQSKCRWRSVLVDEVQDLSQLEVSLLANIYTPSNVRISASPNGLFLVGDGAQTIYKRGFRLGGIGVNINNRSYAFKKNYRNTKEILTAAYALIRGYEFADVDEDNFSQPLAPDFATRHGEKPFLVRCRSLSDEADFVTSQVAELIADKSNPANSRICVIGTNRAVRDAISSRLHSMSIACVELRENAGLDGDQVKISTIESAKGHEFAHVFIAGLVEGALPHSMFADEDLPREASRLYVAMTRARDTLYLSYTSNMNWRPSRFLIPIQKDCTEMDWSTERRTLVPME